MAFFQESPKRQPFLRVPTIVLLLLALLTAIYAIEAFSPTLTMNRIIGRFAFFPAPYSAAFLHAHGYEPGPFIDRALPFVTYMFLHGSWTHLVVNGIWLLPFGSIVARRLGPVLFLVFFLICGIAAAATHLFANWGQTMPVVGASGAIAGLMAAAFRMIGFPYAPDAPPGPLAPIFSPRILLWSGVVIATFVVFGVAGFGAGPGPQLIAWQAHIGGYLAGLVLVGPFVLLRQRLTGDSFPSELESPYGENR